jgi:quercetin dioxygenase-like cupin family protein
VLAWDAAGLPLNRGTKSMSLERQVRIAAGALVFIGAALRLWEREQPAEAKPQTARDYETVRLVLEGKAELHIEGQLVLLEKGDSWVVPKGSRHTYKVIETFPPHLPAVSEIIRAG